MDRQPDSYDFQDLESSLQIFLSSHEEFKNINWKGSAASRFIALLAYNSSIRAASTGFALAESSLATSTVRHSAAAKASGAFNYLPSSMRCAELIVDITVKSTGLYPDSEISLDRSCRFSGVSNSIPLNFVSDDTYTAQREGAFYTFTDVRLLQGIRATNGFFVETNSTIETYVIPNRNVDINTLSVSVKEGDELYAYERYTHPRQLTAGARLYFVRLNAQGDYCIEFGDDTFCRKLVYGENVLIDYIVTSGSEGNGAARVAASGSIGGYNDITVVTKNEYSKGGAEEESLESIKRFAPLGFGMMGACVVDSDYEVAARNYLGEGVSIASWGGEKNNPPKYGYTFLAVKPNGGDSLDEIQKENLIEYLNSMSVGSITPIIKDGNFTYVKPRVSFTYDSKKTVLNQSQLERKVISTIQNFSAASLEKFQSDFIFTRFSDVLNKLDGSIISAAADLSFFKIDDMIEPRITHFGVYNFNFKIVKGSLVVSGFKPLEEESELYEYTLKDDPNNQLIMVKRKISNGEESLFPGVYGSIDHNSGVVNITGLLAESVTELRIEVQNGSTDKSVLAKRDTIFKIEEIKAFGDKR